MQPFNPIEMLNRLPISANVRKWLIYFVIPTLVFAYGVWQSVDGNWRAFFPALGTALVGYIAHAFTKPGVAQSDEVPVYDHTDIEDVSVPPTAIQAPLPVSSASDSDVSLAQSNVVTDVLGSESW